jgi:hypothetical protein
MFILYLILNIIKLAMMIMVKDAQMEAPLSDSEIAELFE